MNVLGELVPYNANIPTAESLDLMRIYPECSEFSGNCGLEFVVADGFEGFG